jgi:hypothetical protein
MLTLCQMVRMTLHSLVCLFTLPMVSLAMQKLFSFMQSYLLILAAVSWAIGILLGSCWLLLYLEVFPICFPVVVSGLTLRSLIYFELTFVLSNRQGLVSIFYWWISTFPTTICWRAYLFFNAYFWHLCWKLNGCRFFGLFSGSLFCWTTCLFLCHYHAGSVNKAVWCNLKSGVAIPPALFFLLRIVLVIQILLCFHMNFRIVFPICEECHWVFWWRLHWICRSLLGIWPFL